MDEKRGSRQCVMRECGRIGCAGRQRETAFVTEPEANAALSSQQRSKEGRGYVMRGQPAVRWWSPATAPYKACESHPSLQEVLDVLRAIEEPRGVATI